MNEILSILVLLLAMLSFGIVGWFIAGEKNCPGSGGFWLGFLMGPLGMVIAMLLPANVQRRGPLLQALETNKQVGRRIRWRRAAE